MNMLEANDAAHGGSFDPCDFEGYNMTQPHVTSSRLLESYGIETYLVHDVLRPAILDVSEEVLHFNDKIYICVDVRSELTNELIHWYNVTRDFQRLILGIAIV